MGVELAAVCFDSYSHPIQAETVMALADLPQRFASPIRRGQLEARFGFAQLKSEPVLVDVSLGRAGVDVPFMLESVREKFQESLLQHLRIDFQHRVPES